MGGKPKPGGKPDKRLKENKTSSSSSSTTKMPRTVKQMNAQHKRMTGGRKS